MAWLGRTRALSRRPDPHREQVAAARDSADDDALRAHRAGESPGGVEGARAKCIKKCYSRPGTPPTGARGRLPSRELNDRKENGKTGARGGSRTHMRKNPRRILSPQRLPFRHPGTPLQI